MIAVNVKVPPGLSLAQKIVSDEITSAMKDSTLLVEGKAKANVPKITSNLARTINSAVVPLGAEVKGIVSASANYARFVEEGTGLFGPKKELIRPKTKKFMKWNGSNGPVFARTTKGQHPKHFMRDAFNSSKPLIEARFNQAIATAVRVMKK
jgi:HK97 gp10 family phage protein